jgi:hypothetical protein
MNVAHSLIGAVVLVFSSAALAHPVSGHGIASAAEHATAAASGPADTKVGSGGARAASSGAPQSATVSHISIGGEPATVLMLAPHPPLTAAERATIRKAGYVEIVQKGTTYFCQRTPMGARGWGNNCFRFASLSDLPKNGSSAKDGQGSGKEKSVSPDTSGAPPSRAMVAVFSPADSVP